MNYSERLNRSIPGGAHTYSRGDDQFPENAPQILASGEGCRVWGPDGDSYLDYGMGLRAVTVGYANKPIAKAAQAEILKGNCLTRASLTELKAAELLCDIIPTAEMVKFAKNGSVTTTAAVKLARAYTGRDIVVTCEDHPFFSYDDWFIGSTVVSSGVPAACAKDTLRFKYGNIDSLETIFAKNPKKIAAVIMEAATVVEPKKGFLKSVEKLCAQEGAVFILDEMITGFRWHKQGAQKYFGIRPDLSTFGKGMANGFSVAALAGKREIMELGGIQHDKERVFLASTTHGAEMCGLGAFIKTMEVYDEKKVVEHLWTYGKKLMALGNGLAKSHGISENFNFYGFPCSPGYATLDGDCKPSLEFRTLFSQEMVKSGVLIPWVALSRAHGDKELERTGRALDTAFDVYSKALDRGIGKYLKSKPIKPVFRKYN